MFFNKKIKKHQNKKGCLKRLVMGIAILVVLGIAAIISLRDTISVFGVKVSEFNNYMNWISEDVNENQLATNPIKPTDLAMVKEKSEQSGLSIFDTNGYVVIETPEIKINSNVTFFDYEVGALINSAMNGSDGGEVFKLLELTILEVDSNCFTLKSVVKFNLIQIKEAVGSYAKNLPDHIYVSSVGEVYVVGSRVQTKNNTIQINQLDKEKNDKIVGLLTEISNASKESNNDVMEITNINNYIVTEVLTVLSQRTNTTPVLGNNTFSLELKS